MGFRRNLLVFPEVLLFFYCTKRTVRLRGSVALPLLFRQPLLFKNSGFLAGKDCHLPDESLAVVTPFEAVFANNSFDRPGGM